MTAVVQPKEITMIRWLQRDKISPINVMAGDKITLTYTNEKGKTEAVMSQDIGRTMRFDEAGVFVFEDEFGMAEGVGGVFGESK